MNAIIITYASQTITKKRNHLQQFITKSRIIVKPQKVCREKDPLGLNQRHLGSQANSHWTTLAFKWFCLFLYPSRLFSSFSPSFLVPLSFLLGFPFLFLFLTFALPFRSSFLFPSNFPFFFLFPSFSFSGPPSLVFRFPLSSFSSSSFSHQFFYFFYFSLSFFLLFSSLQFPLPLFPFVRFHFAITSLSYSFSLFSSLPFPILFYKMPTLNVQGF